MLGILFHPISCCVRLFYAIFWRCLFIINREAALKRKQLNVLETELAACTNYEDFRQIAHLIDEATGMNKWKSDPKSELYDYIGVMKKLISLSLLTYSADDIYELKRQVRAGLVRSVGGIGDVRLHTVCRIGTKVLIQDYIDFVSKTLQYICDGDFDLTIEERFEYFYEARQAYGVSALCLSGGATLGMYHLGVLKVLHQNKLLPRIISGSSVGSIVAAFVATRTEDELEDVFNLKGINFNAFDSKGLVYRRFLRLLTEGVFMDIQKLEKMIRDNILDVTFKEAYDKTNRILNITVASTTQYETSRLLNHLTAPNILIWSAAAASCALSFLFNPVNLMAKDREGNIVAFSSNDMLWSDGSITTDLPMVRLSELFNVNNFIVSQVNPHVVPFMRLINRTGLIGCFIRDEFQLRLRQMTEYFSITHLRWFSSIVNQKYTGNITIIPDLEWRDFLRLLKNPDVTWMLECRNRAERKTWECLHHIKHQCCIELTLDRCTRKLAQELQNMERVNGLLSVYSKHA